MSKSISSLAVGATIEVPVLSAYQSRFGAKIVFKIADKNHSGYPSNSVTLITDKIIQVMAFDAKEPNNSNSDRKNYGNNRYLYSNLLQWQNSNAAAGNWYSAQRSADQAPTTKSTHVSFLITQVEQTVLIEWYFRAVVIECGAMMMKRIAEVVVGRIKKKENIDVKESEDTNNDY